MWRMHSFPGLGVDICEGAIILPNGQGRVKSRSPHTVACSCREPKAKAKSMETGIMERWMTEEVLWKANQTPLGSNQPDPGKVSPSSFMSQDGCLRTRSAADCTTGESIKRRQASGGGTHGGAPSPLTMKRRQYTGKQQCTPKTERNEKLVTCEETKVAHSLISLWGKVMNNKDAQISSSGKRSWQS